jgi:hypothetical protein
MYGRWFEWIKNNYEFWKTSYIEAFFFQNLLKFVFCLLCGENKGVLYSIQYFLILVHALVQFGTSEIERIGEERRTMCKNKW